MDKPMTFDEVFKEAYDHWIDDANIHRYEGAKGLADQVWQHQQVKVEELQLKLSEDNRILHNVIDIERNKNEKLQKRVDAISEVLEELQEQADVIRKRGQKFRDSNFLASADMMDICIKEIEQALKGECKHESDGTNRLSLPPKTRCWKCGEFYSTHEVKDGDQ